MEKHQADPARLTDSEEGKAIGSATESSFTSSPPPQKDEKRMTSKERIAEMDGYFNGYDSDTEADQHHAYIVGFADAVRASSSPILSSLVERLEKATDSVVAFMRAIEWETPGTERDACDHAIELQFAADALLSALRAVPETKDQP